MNEKTSRYAVVDGQEYRKVVFDLPYNVELDKQANPPVMLATNPKIPDVAGRGKTSGEAHKNLNIAFREKLNRLRRKGGNRLVGTYLNELNINWHFIDDDELNVMHIQEDGSLVGEVALGA